MVEVEDVFEYDNEDDHISSMGADIGSVAATGLALSGTAVSFTAAVEILYVYGMSGEATGVNFSLLGPRSEAAIVRNALDAVEAKVAALDNKSSGMDSRTNSMDQGESFMRNSIRSLVSNIG